MKRIKAYFADRKRHKTNFLTIVSPAIGASKLLDAREHDEGLNLGTVRRTADWCWSTYQYLSDDLGRFEGLTESILLDLDYKVLAIKWDELKLTEDEYGYAYRMLNTHSHNHIPGDKEPDHG